MNLDGLKYNTQIVNPANLLPLLQTSKHHDRFLSEADQYY